MLSDNQNLRQLLDDYLRMYASRDDRLTGHFSEDFTGFTGGGAFLVKDRAQWVAITRQDFAQIKDPIRIELKDVAIQSLSEKIAVATGFFTIHLPIKDHILSRETARLVLIFRLESAGWKISHSSISIPYHLVREGEVYPLKELVERNQALEKLIAERTLQLSEANDRLRQNNETLAQEVSEHRRTEESLHKSEERYRSILNATPDDITITDLEGRILMVSPAAFKIFGGQGNEDYIGSHVTDYLVAEDRSRAMAHVALRRQGINAGPREYRGLRLDGTTFDIEVNSEFIRDAGGAPTGIVIIVRDITERKQAEAVKQKLETMNRQLQKADSLGRMAGAIAHHFNNQLQSVLMNLEVAMFERPGTVGSGESLSAAMQSARKAAEMSRLMQTYLGQTMAKRKRLDFSKDCLQRLSQLRPIIPPQVTVESRFPAPGPAIHADAPQLRQILTNLVTNAWEACGDTGGSVCLTITRVSVADIPVEHRFPVGVDLHDPVYACLEVADTGGGIFPDDFEKIFDPFFSSKFPGRGMGLAVALGIARAHDGAITVESELGRGSTFRVFLPVLEEY
ncbi:MAG: PAS domain S-box protein [Opitutaceae bacterium]|jgi:PAS domain S-box-containing protein